MSLLTLQAALVTAPCLALLSWATTLTTDPSPTLRGLGWALPEPALDLPGGLALGWGTGKAQN